MNIINVSTGAVKASKAGGVLKASAIGSCVVITAYDPDTKIGGMAHVMLPGKAPKDKVVEKTRYAADAIDEMIKALENLGAETGNLEIGLAGGGNVLKKEDDMICKSNIASVIELLARRNMFAKAKVLGGVKRRSVSLDVKDGTVKYTEGDSGEINLWSH